MLVVDVDQLGQNANSAPRAVSFQRRFALTVLSGFAVAFALFAVLFALSAEPASMRAGADLRQLPALVTPDDGGVVGTADAAVPARAD